MPTISAWRYDSSAATTTNTVWSAWAISDSTSATADSVSMVWRTWMTTDSTGAGHWQPRFSAQPARGLTAEERVERDRATAERLQTARKRAEEAAAQRAVAEARAEELLLQLLDAEQRAEYAAHRRFRLRAASGRCYELRHGWSGNVRRMAPDGQRAEASYCIHPGANVPEADNLVAQMLMLQTDEAAFDRIANITPLAPRVRERVAQPA